MVDVCAMESRPEQAMVLVEEMEQRGFAATKAALNGIIKACARADVTHSSSIRGDVRTALDVVGMTQSAFEDLENKGFTPDLQSYSGLLLANSRMGRIGGVLRAMTDMCIVGGFEPDKRSVTMLLSSYANALTVGRSEYKRRKLQRELHEHREETHTLYGERVRDWVEEANVSPLGGAYHIHADTGMSEVGWLVGTANVESEQMLLEREAERELAMMNKFDGVGSDVAEILMSLEDGTLRGELQQGALQHGVGEGAGMADMLEDGGGVRAGTVKSQVVARGNDLLGDGSQIYAVGADEDNTDGVGVAAGNSFTLSNPGELGTLGDPLDGGENGENSGGYDDDFGLAALIQSAYNEVGILDGEAQPNEESLLAGASAALQWIVEDRKIEVDTRLLNAYLSVFARCMRLNRALDVYRSFETDFAQPPDADSVIIILEMLTRANQLERALAFFRVATGEWTHHEAVAKTQDWTIKRRKGTRKRKMMKRGPPLRIVPEEGYGACVFGSGTQGRGKEENLSLTRMYGVLLRGCAKSSRFEVADTLMLEMHERGLHPRLKDTFELRRKILMEATEVRGGGGDLSEAETRVLSLLPEDGGVRERVERELMLKGGNSRADGHERLEEGGTDS